MTQISRLIAGELRAYRVWEPTLLGYDGLLNSLMRRESLPPTVQRSGQWYQAHCLRREEFSGFAVHPSPVTEPGEKCSCGFYGVVGGGLFTALQKAGRVPLMDHHPTAIVGSVTLAGRIIVGSTGVVRAQRMRVEALFSMAAVFSKKRRSYLRAAGQQYQVPTYTDPFAFERDFPQADLQELVPELDLLLGVQANFSAQMIADHQELAHLRNSDTQNCNCPGCRDRSRQAFVLGANLNDGMGPVTISYETMMQLKEVADNLRLAGPLAVRMREHMQAVKAAMK